MKNSITYFLLLLFLTGCMQLKKKDPEKDLEGSWQLYDLGQLKNSGNPDDAFANAANLKRIVQEGELLNFFEDNSFTDFKGELIYKTGKWKYSGKDQLFHLENTSGNSIASTLKMKQDSDGKLFFEIVDSAENRDYKFVKVALPLQTFRDDPFYSTNNNWRIKPTSREDTFQLKARLANYFKHLALILNAAKLRKQDAVSFAFSLGPVKMYNGAIGMYNYKTTPFSWKNGYYDDADAKTAYYMYQDYISRGNYKGASVGDWMEDDYTILLSIYADFNTSLQKNMESK